MKRIIVFIGLTFLFTSLSPTPASAAHEFLTSFTNTYNVRENGITRVTQKITLTNQTTDYRASKYKFIIKSPDIENVSAADSGGALKLEIKKTADTTEIEVEFNDIVVGKNQKLNWSISYDTQEFAQNYGAVWEINLPGLPDDEDLAGYSVNLFTPDSFGNPQYSYPPSAQSLFWTKEEIGNSTISVLFGEKQNYSFFLKYHLKNTKAYPISTELALPMDTGMQKVYLSKIEPPPLDVVIDRDGNWLAQYNLEIGESKTIKVEGISQISFYPESGVDLTPEDKILYTKARLFWEADNEEIKNLARELKTAENIYHYVVDTLSYDYSKIDKGPVERLGALKALKNPKNAICMEFTDLFIAIARAAGIPARELDGYAYTTNPRLRPISLEKDILHSWPQYYDEAKKMWIQIDPTWGDTTGGVNFFSKLDLNHFAFIQKGEDSEYPIPAGSYREDYSGKDVQVEIIKLDKIENSQKKPVVEFALPSVMYGGFPYKVDFFIVNPTGRLLESSSLSLTSSGFTISPAGEIMVEKLPPFAIRQKTFTLKTKSLLANNETVVESSYYGDINSKKALLRPVFFAKMSLALIGGIFAVIIFIIIIAFAKRSRRLSLQRLRQ